MTVQEQHDYFDLLLDKEGDPYFTRENKDLYLNMAHLEYIKRMLPSNEGGSVNIEATQLVYNNLYTLVKELSGFTMDAGGLVPTANIQTSLNTATSGTDPLMYIMNVSMNGYPVQYTRHNDWYMFETNSLKKGTTTQPRYKYDTSNITFSPISQAAAIKITVLKTPRSVDFQNGVNSELPEHTHKSITELAVELASVSLREGDLTQLNSLQENK